ncbi:inorganic phosphate transporter, PiT family [Halopelagius inordinatus]|uniref:Phosphate transporter n=1 Tax=Halopelagius inordinatus TaxID=553467 RepID=A0A1I2V4B1_9EURY|nr:inorganic phosphate transporter [Halopelagius inordinatus]SFG84030.1 inorganic phosphate transporter, PiT family [Halopelagius inordinatus]
MVSLLLVSGLVVAAFVGYNIGGSSTGVAFGPAVGSRIVRKVTAGALFTLFAFWGAWTVGRNVIDTMSDGIVPATQFSPEASVGVLFFSGVALLISNVYGVPASTSMTAVGAIVGLGLATDTLNETVMFTIVSAWIVAPLVGLTIGVVTGRYLYPHLDARFSFGRLSDPLVQIDRSGFVPRPRLNRHVPPRDVVGSLLVLGIACYMGFSAGASNAANAVAPLVGNGSITIEQGILLAVASIGLGGFTIARRTLATVGDDITDLPILAALVVSVVGATIITVLSQLGIPASLAVSTTCCIIGLGWGRASRVATLAEIAAPDGEPASRTPITTGALGSPPTDDDSPAGPTVGGLARGEDEDVDGTDDVSVPPIGEEEPEDVTAESLFDPAATGRIVALWILSPTLSVIGSFLLFTLVL